MSKPTFADLFDDLLLWLDRRIRYLTTPPRQPDHFTLSQGPRREIPMHLVYPLLVTPAPIVPDTTDPADVVTAQIATATVNGVAGTPVTIPISVPPVPVAVGQFAVGVAVSVSLVDVNAAGIQSLPEVESYTIVDQTVPPQPGVFGFGQGPAVQVLDPGDPGYVAPDAPPATG